MLSAARRARSAPSKSARKPQKDAAARRRTANIPSGMQSVAITALRVGDDGGAPRGAAGSVPDSGCTQSEADCGLATSSSAALMPMDQVPADIRSAIPGCSALAWKLRVCVSPGCAAGRLRERMARETPVLLCTSRREARPPRTARTYDGQTAALLAWLLVTLLRAA
jgi:hypothetical protein